MRRDPLLDVRIHGVEPVQRLRRELLHDPLPFGGGQSRQLVHECHLLSGRPASSHGRQHRTGHPQRPDLRVQRRHVPPPRPEPRSARRPAPRGRPPGGRGPARAGCGSAPGGRRRRRRKAGRPPADRVTGGEHALVGPVADGAHGQSGGPGQFADGEKSGCRRRSCAGESGPSSGWRLNSADARSGPWRPCGTFSTRRRPVSSRRRTVVRRSYRSPRPGTPGVMSFTAHSGGLHRRGPGVGVRDPCARRTATLSRPR